MFDESGAKLEIRGVKTRFVDTGFCGIVSYYVMLEFLQPFGYVQ